ncbi:Crp/Fnr family transcriptional regulator [Holophaga foetida]|uniref:Crp/Fnr family transcriptional regulator n=1 Tax=Holophaga foetida TaxID=35839 RepID=UPI00024750D6|nr:Crp/Fnr family transcriptional regulator [Holophaga foetida]
MPTWSQAPLFQSLSPAQVEHLASISSTKALEEGQILFMEDAPCTGFFVLMEGAIQLTRVSTTPGAHPTLAVILPVQSFAEAAMFGGEAFPATATALKPTRVQHFPKANVLAAMAQEPALALAIIHAQAVWLRKLTQKVESLSSSDSQERLRRWLNDQLPVNLFFKLPLTKKALAASLGMTPETLSRALRTMQDEGLIEVRGNSILRLKLR